MTELHPSRDVSYVAIRQLKAASVILIAAMVAIAGLGIVKDEQGASWILMPTAIGFLALGIALVILRRRLHTLREAKRVRDSLLKHVWEERHKREW